MADVVGVKRIYVLCNGKPNVPGRRMVLAPRTFRTWDAILKHMSSTLGFNVKRIYDLHAETEIDRYAGLAGLEDGWRYVAVAQGDKFRPGTDYLFPDGPVKPIANGDEVLARKNSMGPHIPQVVRKLGLEVHGGPKTTSRVFDQNTKGVRVYLFANGDERNPAVSVVLNARNCQSFNHLLETVTNALQYPSYVRRLYNAESTQHVSSLKQLHDGISLVGVAAGSLKLVPYKIPEHDNRAVASGEEQEEVGAPAVLVCVFLPNGVAFHSGTRATVSRGRFDDIDKLLAHLSQHLKLPFGRPRRIYALPSGRRIRSIPALLSSGATHFSVATDEPFIECEYLNSRDLKPPTAGVARVWEEKEGGEDRSRSAPGYIQRHGARVSNEENSAEAKQGKKEVEKEKKRAPAKPVLSFMETLEMSKKLLERQRELSLGPSTQGTPDPILLQRDREPRAIPDEEPSESQLDMFIEASRRGTRKRVSFGSGFERSRSGEREEEEEKGRERKESEGAGNKEDGTVGEDADRNADRKEREEHVVDDAPPADSMDSEF